MHDYFPFGSLTLTEADRIRHTTANTGCPWMIKYTAAVRKERTIVVATRSISTFIISASLK